MKNTKCIIALVIAFVANTAMYANENDSTNCTGCEMSFIADLPAKLTENGDLISSSSPLLRIADADTSLCDSMPNNNSLFRKIGIRMYVQGHDAEENCTSEATDCSESTCKIQLNFIARITDINATYGEPCMILGSEFEISFRINNTVITKTTEEIAEALRQAGGSTVSISLVDDYYIPFEQQCGNTRTLDISADFIYNVKRDSLPPERKVVSHDFHNLKIKCESCTEETSGNPNKIRQQHEILHQVFPNPADNKINFVFNGTQTHEVSLLITNIMGQTVHQSVNLIETEEQQLSVNVHDLNNGTYFYTYTINGIPHNGKIVVNH